MSRIKKPDAGVYCFLNTVNGKRYVGSSIELSVRRARHLSQLRRGKHENPYFQRAWNKYGESAFAFSVIIRCAPEMCVDLEQECIDEYQAADKRYGYNCSSMAGLAKPGARLSEETKARMSAALREAYASGKRKPVKMTEELRAKIAAHPANRNPEKCAKHSVRMSGRKQSPEAVAKTAAGNRAAYASGKRKRGHSMETRAKISATQKGRKLSEERRIKIAAALVGRECKAETRAKIGAGNRGERCGSSKLTEDQVREIKRRVRLGEKRTAIAHELGVSQSTVTLIVLGRRWKHLAEDGGEPSCKN